MKIEVSMTQEEQKFYAHSYWAREPEFVLETLRAHLSAAQVIWPELKVYGILKRRTKNRAESVRNEN